ncbi:hypothetical protein ISCGN_032851 [Ixodes scapularis]
MLESPEKALFVSVWSRFGSPSFSSESWHLRYRGPSSLSGVRMFMDALTMADPNAYAKIFEFFFSFLFFCLFEGGTGRVSLLGECRMKMVRSICSGAFRRLRDFF